MRSRSKKFKRSTPNVHPFRTSTYTSISISISPSNAPPAPFSNRPSCPKNVSNVHEAHISITTQERRIRPPYINLQATFPCRGLGSELGLCCRLFHPGAGLSYIDRVAISVVGRAGLSCSRFSDPSVSGRGMGYIVSRLQTPCKEPRPESGVNSRLERTGLLWTR